MKSYFVVLILGLFVACICLCFCPNCAIAGEPLEVVLVQPSLDTTNGQVETALTRLKAVEITWPTTAFTESQMEAAVEATADLLIDGDPNTVGWAFNVAEQGVAADANNIYGVIGMGLLRAYNMTKEKSGASITAGKAGYLKAAGKVADLLISGGTLQATDYIFLFLYSQASGDGSYATAAGNGLDNDVIDGNVPAFVANILDGKYTGQGRFWQLANWAEAFQFHDANYADAIVSNIITNDYETVGTGADEVGGFVYDPNNDYVRTLDQARMLDVLANYYSTTYAAEITAGLALLQDLQYTNGYVRWGCQLNMATDDVTLFPSVMVQDQAFAVRALAFNAQTTWDNYDDRLGTFWAANGLLHMQDTGGGFTTSKQTLNISEYNAEALLALHASCREGDVDRSGKVIAGDALSALKAAVGMENLTGPALLNADRDGNGVISANDALEILQASVGKVVAVNQGTDIGLI